MRERHAGSIPTVIVEEHHEAFYVWNYAVQRGWLSSSGNTLLHVDAHSDMLLPRLRRPLASIGDLADLADFTYRELDIGSFIWPAVYLRIFNRLLWVKCRDRLSRGKSRSISVCAKNPLATEFFIAPSLESAQQSSAGDPRVLEYASVTISDCLKTDQPVVLDIDLDYFCSNDYPDLPHREIEITQDVFEDFRNNPYHFLRLSPADKTVAVARDGKYYLAYNEYFPQRPGKNERLTEIQERLDGFINYLQTYSVTPPLIVICRSFHSGYTPGDCVDYIQQILIDRLAALFPLEKLLINDILPLNVLPETVNPGCLSLR